MIKLGRIKSIDHGHARGEIECDSEIISFSLTSFHSGRPRRFPKLGESVEIIFSGEEQSQFLFARLPRNKKERPQDGGSGLRRSRRGIAEG